MNKTYPFNDPNFRPVKPQACAEAVQPRPLEIPDMLSQCRERLDYQQSLLCGLTDKLQVVCCPETPDTAGGAVKEPSCVVSGLGHQLFDLWKTVDNNNRRIKDILNRLQF